MLEIQLIVEVDGAVDPFVRDTTDCKSGWNCRSLVRDTTDCKS